MGVNNTDVTFVLTLDLLTLRISIAHGHYHKIAALREILTTFLRIIHYTSNRHVCIYFNAFPMLKTNIMNIQCLGILWKMRNWSSAHDYYAVNYGVKVYFFSWKCRRIKYFRLIKRSSFYLSTTISKQISDFISN